MTAVARTYELISDLPVQRIPSRPYLDIPTLVPHLLDLHPEWSFEDVREFLEEKTRLPMHPEDQITLRTFYQRCLRLRQEFEAEIPLDR